MALHIFHFIPFSIPFRFPFCLPFRVLVTPPFNVPSDGHKSEYCAHKTKKLGRTFQRKYLCCVPREVKEVRKKRIHYHTVHAYCQLLQDNVPMILSHKLFVSKCAARITHFKKKFKVLDVL